MRLANLSPQACSFWRSCASGLPGNGNYRIHCARCRGGHALYANAQSVRKRHYYNSQSFSITAHRADPGRGLERSMSTVCRVIFSPSSPPHGECRGCAFNAWCLPANLTLPESRQFNDRIHHRRPIKHNEYLHRAGSELKSLFVVNSGFLKTSITNGGGHHQVTGFSMAGELVGLDAIGTGKHQCDTSALGDSHLCGMRYSDFEELGHAIPALQHHFHRVMGAEIARDYGILILLGTMRVEERVAVFLLNLSTRFSARGYSGTHFRLPMTRQDIASYLGLKMETVSRAFSHLSDIQLIATEGKDIEIKSLLRLQQAIGVQATRQPVPRRTRSGTH